MPPGDDAPALLEVGRVARAHGLGGEVIVELWSEESRLAAGSVLVTERGPLTVASARPYQGRYLVRFESVGDRPTADALRGLALRAEPLRTAGTLWVHELVGSPVVSADGKQLGVVEALEPNPASDLLVLDSGGLVPLRFVVSFEPGQPVVVEIPDGLLD